MHSLYEWSHAEAVASDPILQLKALYLNVPFFYARQAFYFIVWGTMGHLLTKWSAEHDRTGDPELLDKLATLSGAGLVIYFLTVTFAMVDWTMSVNPHWFSTIWGMLYIGGQGLSAFAFGICVLVMLSQTAPLNRVLTTHHFHDLGKFLFAFLMLWAYLSFSQFLIIWSANIPEEIPHYLDRWENSYKYLSIFIIVGHFIVPYALLLSRDLKKNAGKLRVIATWILFARARRLLLARRAGAAQGRAVDQPARRRAAAGARRHLHFAVRVATSAAVRCCRSTIRTLDKALHHHVH